MWFLCWKLHKSNTTVRNTVSTKDLTKEYVVPTLKSLTKYRMLAMLKSLQKSKHSVKNIVFWWKTLQQSKSSVSSIVLWQKTLHKLPVGNEPINSLCLAVFSFNKVQPCGRFVEKGRVHRKLIYICCRQLFRNHRYTCRAGALPIKHVMPTAVWLQEQRSPRTLNQRVSCNSKVWQPWINSSPATAKPNVKLTRDQQQQILTTLNQRQTSNSKV